MSQRSTRTCAAQARTGGSRRPLVTPQSRQFAYEMAVGVATPTARRRAERRSWPSSRRARAAGAAAQSYRTVAAPLTRRQLPAPSPARAPHRTPPRSTSDLNAASPTRRSSCSRIARLDGHHPAADETRLSPRSGLRLRARRQQRQGFPGHARRRADGAVRRAIRTQAVGRPARQHRRRHRPVASAIRRPAREWRSRRRGRSDRSRGNTTPAAGRWTPRSCARRSARCWTRRGNSARATREKSSSVRSTIDLSNLPALIGKA